MERARGLWLLLGIGVLALSCVDAPVIPAANRKPRIERIAGIPGPEDLVFDGRFGRLLVSSHDRRGKAERGRIIAVDLKTREPRAMDLRFGNLSDAFAPHGIAMLDSLLFVINHAHVPESIDVFTIGRDELTLRERITGPAIAHPNDLDVRGTSNGYELWFSNPAQGRAQLWEALIGPHSSYVAHIRSGNENVTRTYGFRFANGVAFHPSGRVWVASSFDEKLLRLGDPTDEIELDSVGDNITREGMTMLVTAGESASRVGKHLRAGASGENELPASPTLVWRVRLGERPATQLLFHDDGTNISGGSAAVCVDGNLYIGQVMNDYVLKAEGAC